MQKTALIVGIVFILVGAAGFIPGLTQHAEHLQGAGTDSEAMLLGIFQVSILHNIVHLAFGVWGLAAAKSMRASRTFLLIGGIIYLVLWIYGLFAVGNDQLNFVPLNDADNWLHLVLAAGMILLSFVLNRDHRSAAAPRTGR
ncbi:DUF4383 domain-containing protein [Actinomycetales bacterium SN12]|nr:DUF4383 domain-containing protein [Actinomycetales bacterium SN12]